MKHLHRVRDIVIILLALLYLKECTRNIFQNIDEKYYIVSEAYRVAKALFIQGRTNYDSLKNTSLHVMDTFLDLVHIMNNEMAKELRGAVIKFYKIKYFHDFTNYVISLEEATDMIDHCLIEPVEKIDTIRKQFHKVINNFEDIRQFDTVNKCINELPDEVAAAHCILHQAVLFNETMQESLMSIVEIKTNQHVRKMNASIYEVQNCLNNLVPYFFEQLLVETYTDKCKFLTVINTSIEDLLKDKWRNNTNTQFPKKWSPLVGFLKERSLSTLRNIQQSLFATLLSANLSSVDIIKALYS